MKIKLADQAKKNLMQFPWIIFWGLIGPGSLLTLMMLTGHGFPYSILGVLLLVLGWTQYSAGKKQISARPPQMGVVTYWGEKQVIGGSVAVVSEGVYLTMPYWPFYIDLLPIDVGKINKDDVPIRDIICKSPSNSEQGGKVMPGAGGRISAFFSYTFTPDPKRMKEYIDSKEERGVTEILENQISETIRQKGRVMTWEEFQFSGDRLTAEIVVRLSGDKPIKLKRDQDNHDLVWVNPSTGKPEEETPPVKLEINDALDGEITYFLEQKVRGNSSYADVQDLGVIIHRANVEKFELGESLKKAAEKMAEEEQERRGEVYETETELQQAQLMFDAYKKAGTPKTLEDCLLEVRRRKSQREGKDVKTIELPGLADGIKAIADLVVAMKGGK